MMTAIRLHCHGRDGPPNGFAKLNKPGLPYSVLHPEQFAPVRVEEHDRLMPVRRLKGHFYVVEEVFE
jgi:hypothetical protein